MHNNYYFLRQLSRELESKIIGSKLVECYSQDKNEIVFDFLSETTNIFIKADLRSQFCCLSFPAEPKRSKRNSADLFPLLIGKKVRHVVQYQNERCFSIQFNGNLTLLFKMHGNRSNLVLFKNRVFDSMFLKGLKKDTLIELDKLDRPIDQTLENYIEQGVDGVFPTLGKLLEGRLPKTPTKESWDKIQQYVTELESPNVFIVRKQGKLALSLFSEAESIFSFANPLEAINKFYGLYASEANLAHKKLQLISEAQSKINKTVGYLSTTKRQFKKLDSQLSYHQIADLIMANLHEIPTRATTITVQNFYTNQPTTIKLKADLSPQKNAENYYRKGKNFHKQVNFLQQNIAEAEARLLKYEDLLWTFKSITSIKELKNHISQPAQTKPENSKFKEFEFSGYKILVGKNAKNNDELTLKHAHKEDLWLHAKDVSGSHVVVKFKSGQPFGKDIIEKAAELAAFYSKRKTDSLCPVTYTPKKYVRKRKGSPAGAVVVEKEKVVLVVPNNWAS